MKTIYAFSKDNPNLYHRFENKDALDRYALKKGASISNDINEMLRNIGMIRSSSKSSLHKWVVNHR